MELQELVNQKVEWYKSRGRGIMSDMMMNEVEGQFIDMANGGDGSIVGNGEIRDAYYPGMPNQFFQQICDGMGWDWGQQTKLPFM